MKKPGLMRLLKLCFFLPVLFALAGCPNGSRSNPVPASVSIKPLSTPKFCYNASVGEMCNDTKGGLRYKVEGKNDFTLWGLYNETSTKNSGFLTNPNSVWYEKLLIGSSTAHDALVLTVPQGLKYKIFFQYTQYGSDNPMPNNTNCPNLYQNNTYYCKRWDIMHEFNPGVIPTASNFTVDFNPILYYNAAPNCH